MKLVVDNEKVSELPIRNLQDIAAMARGFGTDVEDEVYGDVVRVMVVVETADNMHLLNWGETSSVYEAIGLFEAAKIATHANMYDD
jgi:hypothetical protein